MQKQHSNPQSSLETTQLRSCDQICLQFIQHTCACGSRQGISCIDAAHTFSSFPVSSASSEYVCKACLSLNTLKWQRIHPGCCNSVHSSLAHTVPDGFRLATDARAIVETRANSLQGATPDEYARHNSINEEWGWCRHHHFSLLLQSLRIFRLAGLINL